MATTLEPEEVGAAPSVATALGAVSSVRLGAVVFMGGAGTLATEIAASRLLAPFFGSSTVVWANIIGLILIYLSVGYWFGGKVADRWPNPRVLGGIIFLAAAAISILPFISRPILELALRGLDSVSAGAVVGSFFAALALFAIPITLLGMVAPFAIRLAISTIETAGSTAGRLYALSTVGSILGTFISAIIAIPLIGTQRTMLGAAALLALSAALLLGFRWQAATAVFAALLAIPAGAVKASDGLIYETESSQQYIQVLERSNGARSLRLNEGVASHSIWREDTVLTGGVWDMFLVLPPLLDEPPESMLVIGNSGGTVARAFGELYPDVKIDGVEIDPKVTEVGERFLGLGDNPNLTVITADGRPHLRLTDKRYDIIIVDAYKQPYIPFYLATREFFELTRDRLNPDGLLALNVAAVPDDDRLSEAIASTLLAEYPQVWRWKPLRFNELQLGYNTPVTRAELVDRSAGVHADVKVLGELFARDVFAAEATDRPLTDDRAPV
ncbi:MAG: spermidine synthase, partial [Gaiellaceae bacterium]